MRKIYIASSWKNANEVQFLAHKFRQWGHEVFAFCEEGEGHFVFGPADMAAKGVDINTLNAKTALEHEEFQKAYESDRAGLDWADTVVLLLPAGNSSHLEAGYIAGQGLDLFILGDMVEGEFDAMYGFAQAICDNLADLRTALSVVRAGSTCPLIAQGVTSANTGLKDQFEIMKKCPAHTMHRLRLASLNHAEKVSRDLLGENMKLERVLNTVSQCIAGTQVEHIDVKGESLRDFINSVLTP